MKKSNDIKINLYKRKTWSVYIVRCADGTLYTGISNDVKNRVKFHNSGKGAKYIVPARRPVSLVYEEKGFDYGQALKRERGIKKSGKAAKEKLSLKPESSGLRHGKKRKTK